MKIAFFEIEEWQKKRFQDALPDSECIFFDRPISLSDLDSIRDVEILVTFVYSGLDRDVLSSLPSLRFISTMSTGFDHIDVDYCRQNNIVVSNIPRYGERSVAEHTIALMLALARNIYRSIERTHRNKDFNSDASIRSINLNGRTLGIIGGGRIGGSVAAIAKAFSMNVMVYDKVLDSFQAKEKGYTYASFEHLLKESDMVSLHLPLNKDTFHIINDRTLRLMKEKAILINTARGGLVDTMSLLEALKERRIGGAALDVLECEHELKGGFRPSWDDHRKSCTQKSIVAHKELMSLNNVIITPHDAYNSEESIKLIMDATIENIFAFISESPINVVGQGDG